MGQARRRATGFLVAGLLTLAAGPLASTASASHDRYQHLTWKKGTGNDVEFTLRSGFRRDGYAGSDPDGSLAVGDVFEEYVGGTFLDFGDGDTTSTLQFRVTFVNKPENYVLATALEEGTMAATISHTYPGPGPWEAQVESCCTISELNNNPDGTYRSFADVNLATDTESPVSSLFPVVPVNNSGTQQFVVPATYNGSGNATRFRLADAAESCAGCAVPQPPGMTINANTGQVSWNTTGVPTGLYYAVVVVEGVNNAGVVLSNTSLQFLINVQEGTAQNQPPAFVAPTPADGSEFTVQVGSSLTIPFRAEDPDAGDVVTISSTGNPPHSTFNGTPGNPANASLTVNPQAGDEGDYIVNVLAQDDGSPPLGASRSYTIHVVPATNPSPAGRMVSNARRAPATFASIVDCSAATANARNRPFQIQWNGKTFKATSYSAVTCSNDPSFTPSPAPATAAFDTQTGTAAGTVNGASGYTLTWRLEDRGAPSPADQAALRIVKDSDSSVALDVPLGPLTSGQNFAMPPAP